METSSSKQVTTFRFTQDQRDELDRIQQHLGKSTWQQTINFVIDDYRRLVDDLMAANKANHMLDMKLKNDDRRLRNFRSAFRDIMEMEEPETAKNRAEYPSGSLLNVFGDDDD